jgi:hypothetical protein
MLPPWVVADKFYSLYPNRLKGIVRPPGWKNWKVVSKHWYIPDQSILSAVAGKEADFFGLRWGEQTRFAVLDIDSRTSQYYNGAKLAELLARLAEVGLKANIYQSSASRGWHLYLPFDQPEQSDEVERTLKRWLKALGYQIINGQLEVFPSGNGLRLPLQPGFAWLDQQSNLVRTREELSTDEALASFLMDLEAKARNWAEAKKLIESQISAIDRAAGRGAQAHEKRLNLDGLEQIYSRGKIEDIWEKGRKWWRDGLLNNGERHDAVLAVGHYLWFGDVERQIPALPGSHRNDEYRALLIEQWLNKSHNNKCRHINEGKWEIVQDQIERAVIWRPKKEEKPREPYLLTDRLLKRLIALYRRTGRIWSIEQFEKANQNRKLEARARIAEAICELEDEGTQISIAEVARRAKADWRTVKKNWDLRAAVLVRTLEEKRTSKTEANKDLLACSGGDYNQLGGWGTGASSEIESSKGSLENIVADLVPLIQERPDLFDQESLHSEPGSGIIPSQVGLVESVTANYPPTDLFEKEHKKPLLRLLAGGAASSLELAPIGYSVFETLRLKLFGATANNSTASETLTLEPSLRASLATGSNTGAPKRCMWVKPGVSGSLLKRLPPRLAAGPLHLPQTGFLLVAPARARDFAPGSGQIFYMAPQALFRIRTDFLYGAARNYRGLEQVSFYGKLGHQSNRKLWRCASRGPPLMAAKFLIAKRG